MTSKSSLPNGSRVISQVTTFADWQTQLKLACEADRREDIKAIAASCPPQTVVLRHIVVVQEAAKTVTSKDTVVFSGGARRKLYRDEAISYEAIRTLPDVAPLPDFPAAGDSDAEKLRRHLLHTPYEFAGTCLFWVRSLEALRLLENAGASTDDLGWMEVPLLVYMAEQGRLDIVRFLLEERGHAPNAARANGHYTALHWAKGLDTVQYLIEQGADLNILTNSGDSVLAQQMRSGQAEVIDYLLSLGAERASRANLLHWLDAHPAILRILCRHHIPLQEPIESTFGESGSPLPLHRVLQSGIEAWGFGKGTQNRTERAAAVVESVDILLTHGCDPLLRDGNGRLPYHVVQDGLPDVEELLRQQLDERLARYDGPRRTRGNPRQKNRE